MCEWQRPMKVMTDGCGCDGGGYETTWLNNIQCHTHTHTHLQQCMGTCNAQHTLTHTHTPSTTTTTTTTMQHNVCYLDTHEQQPQQHQAQLQHYNDDGCCLAWL